MLTKSKNLKQAIEKLDIEEIEEISGIKVFRRGEEYFKDGAILEAKYSSDFQTITAEVKGSEPYHCTIRLVNYEIISECSCPYDGFCKHLVAVFLFAIQEDVGVALKKETSGTQSSFGDYLHTLPKKSLEELVMKFAPEEYRREIENGFAGNDFAISQFFKVKKKIEQLFRDEHLMYDPLAFESALMKNLNQLRGLTGKIPDDIGDLILSIMEDIENSLDKGLLYADDYYNEAIFESEDFQEFALEYLKRLPLDQKTDFMKRLFVLLDKASYDTFALLGASLNKVIFQQDKKAVKEILINELATMNPGLTAQYYLALREELTHEEKESVLMALNKNSDAWILELCELYEKQNRIKDALMLIKEHIGESFGQEFSWGNQPFLMKYLDLLVADGQQTYAFSLQAIRAYPRCEMLIKISELQNGNTAEHEKIVEENNAGQLLEFYIKTDKIQEAHQLVLRSKTLWEGAVLGFYKKFKKEYPAEASDFFLNIIRKNLVEAKNSHYENIVDALKQLQMINKQLFMKLMTELRQNYKRRGNLMKMIAEL